MRHQHLYLCNKARLFQEQDVANADPEGRPIP
jgi:hypothetical protein